MLILFASARTVYAEMVADVTKIAGRSEKDVASYLGQPALAARASMGIIV